MTAASTASGAVRYAGPSGTGPETSCPQSNPCGIQTAVEGPSVETGDEIVVLPGDYALGADPLTAPFDVNLHGADGQSRPRLTVTANPGVTIRGRIADIEITGSLHTAAASATTVERLIVHGDCVGLATFTLLRNTVCRSYSSTGSSGVQRDATLRNATLVGGGVFLGAFSAGTEITVDARNTIVEGGAADVSTFTDSSGAAATADLDSSNYDTESEMGTSSTVTNPGTGNNQTAAPLFVDAAAGDFHEQAGSPTRNAGSAAASQIGALDIDREPRAQESAPDIGADEFDVAAPETTIDSGPKKKTKKRKATFEFSSSETDSTFECLIDKKGFKPCTSPIAYRKLKRRKHSFQVRAIDVHGNTDATPDVQKWRVKKKK